MDRVRSQKSIDDKLVYDAMMQGDREEGRGGRRGKYELSVYNRYPVRVPQA